MLIILPINVDHPTGHKVKVNIHRLLQRKPAAAVRPQHVLEEPDPGQVHRLHSAKGCICIAEFGTVNNNFDSIDWLAFIDCNYNSPCDQTIREARNVTIRALQSIQQKQRVCIVLKDKKVREQDLM